jgi:hypothetical protein
MLSARTIFEEIFDGDEAFRLFCPIAASGEAQGGWENGRIAIYRDVSTAVMGHLGRILGWPRWEAAVLTAGIRTVYVNGRLRGWRRMVSLRMPTRRNALGSPAPAQSSRA